MNKFLKKQQPTKGLGIGPKNIPEMREKLERILGENGEGGPFSVFWSSLEISNPSSAQRSLS
jgi:hypothetical protein